MSHQDPPDAPDNRIPGTQPTPQPAAGSDAAHAPRSGPKAAEGGDPEHSPGSDAEPAARSDMGRAASSDPDDAATTDPDPAATTDRDSVTYQGGGDFTAGEQATLASISPYAWWFLIAAPFELLFGGIGLGTPQATQIHVSPSWVTLIYIAVGSYIAVLGFGVLRLERWAYWGAWPATLALATLSAAEIVRRVRGVSISYQTTVSASLNVLFFLFNAYFLLQPETRKTLRYRPFNGRLFSPGMALCGVALVVPSLALTLFLNYANKHLSDPTLLLVFLLVGVLMIVMGFCGVRLQRWVWAACSLETLILIGVSLYIIARSSPNTQGLIASGIGLVIAFLSAYGLFTEELRAAVFRAREKQALFSPRTLVGGLSLAVLALVIYLLPGELGTVAVTDAVFGLAIGTVVGLLPGADPANRISAYYAGALLAFASYVARGGLLPYTKGSSALVVLLMLVIITAVTAVVRSRAWFVLMLLGVASIYGLAEGKFQAAPSAYLAAAGLAFVGTIMGFSLGFMVSSLLAIELVPYKPELAASSSATAASSLKSGEPADDKRRAEAA